MVDVLLFIADKILGAISPLFKRKIVISPKNKRIGTSRDSQSEYRYFLFLVNQKDKPFYNLNLHLSAEIQNMPARIMVNPVFDGQEYKPTHPIAAGNPRTEPIVDIGYMGFFNADSNHFSYNLRISHIDPRETKRFEVIISNIKPERKFKVEHSLTFLNEAPSLEVKRESKPGQVSVSVQGLNWKIKK